jgi:glycine cleavage system transcriptional repressor
MNKLIVTVLGKDRPGIIALIASRLYDMGCNLENVNQMILQHQFAGFFIVEASGHQDPAAFKNELDRLIAGNDLNIHVNSLDAETGPPPVSVFPETFMITTIGPDQKGLVARFSKIMADFGANITHLKAVFKGGNNPLSNIMTYQIDIPEDADPAGLFAALREKGAELGLDVRIQHKKLFETIHKI